jgi:tetratricopeptide (TPR) repeat protein
MTRRLLIAAIVATVLGGPAFADAVPPLARQFSDRGRALHDLGDYDQAIVAYKQAYMIAPSPGLLFNMAQAYRLAGDCPQAASFYRRFLSTGPEPEARRVTEQHLAVVESCVRRGGSGGPALALRAHDDPAVDEPGAGKRHLGMAIAGGGGLLLVAGVYFALDARSASDQVANAYAHGASWKMIADLDQRGQRSSEIAAGLAITGGAAVATGVVLYILGRRDDATAERIPAVTVAPGAHGGGRVELAWRF